VAVTADLAEGTGDLGRRCEVELAERADAYDVTVTHHLAVKGHEVELGWGDAH